MNYNYQVILMNGSTLQTALPVTDFNVEDGVYYLSDMYGAVTASVPVANVFYITGVKAEEAEE